MRLAFLTNASFEVTELITGPADAFGPGTHLLELVADSPLSSTAAFLEQLSDLGVALSIPLQLRLNQQLSVLRFSAYQRDSSILVVAAEHDRTALELLGEIDDVKARVLRHLLSGLASVAPEESHRLYEELSRTTNSLSTLHRELALKKRELDQTHAALQAVAAELERLNEEKNHFIGMAAHDLRNPIGSIGLYAEMILDKPEVDAEVHFAAAEILEISSGMGTLVNEVLDVAAIESGTFSLQLSEVDLDEAVNRSVSLHRHLADRKQLELNFNGGAEAGSIEADAGKLGQVLDNLITNAVKFSYPGSPIVVAVHGTGDGASVSVRDYGVGIAADEQSRLFNPFEKLSSRSTAGESNTGLGLAIVRKIVEAHGGRIEVNSSPGEGSEFTVWLPRRQGSHSSTTEDARTTHKGTHA